MLKYALPLLFMLITSCSWFKNPVTPNVEAPKQFNSITDKYTNIESLPYLAWWQQFHDKELNYLIESGLTNNLDIQMAISNLEVAKGQLNQVKLSWIPFVNLYTGFSSNPALGDPGMFFGAWPQYSINIVQTYKQQQQAEYNLAVSQAMIDGVRLMLIGQISASYFTLISSQEQLHLLEQLDMDMKELITLTQQQLTIGIQNDLDLAQINSDEKLIQAQMTLIKQNIVLSRNSLRYLLNENPGNVQSTDNFKNIDFSQFKPGSLPATVLQNRPDLIMAENSVKASYTGVAVAYGNLFPKIQLDNFVGMASGNGTVATPNTPITITDAYVNWGISPSVFGQIEAQKGAYQGQVYKYIQTVRKILKEVDDSYTINKYNSENYNHTLASWQELNKKYMLQKGLYQTGIISYPELIGNKLNVDRLALIVNQSKLQQALSLVNLYQNLAGGYKYESASQGK